MAVDFAELLTQLWRRRLWMLAVLAFAFVISLVTVYHVSLAPPGLKTKSIELGAAETQLIVDAPRSGIGDLTRDLDPLNARAQVLSQLMRSDPVVREIAKIMNVPPSVIEAQTDNSALNIPQNQLEPGQAKRANQIASEGRVYRLTFQAVPDQPTVSVFSQADTPAIATKLANAAVVATREWITSVQGRQLVPEGRRTVVTQLGSADSGFVNKGASRMFAVLIFIAIFAFGCVAILLVNRLLLMAAARRTAGPPAVEGRRGATARTAPEQRNGHAPAKARTLAASGGGKSSRRSRRTSN